MTNPSPGLPQPVRRVPLTELRERVPRFSRTKRRLLPPCCPYNAASYSRPPHMERASPASPNSAASFPNCPNQCGEFPTDRHAGNEFSPALTNSAASFYDRHAGSESSLLLPRPQSSAASRPPTAKQCGELLRLSRTVQTNAASPLMHPRTVGEYLLLPRILRRTVLRTKTAQHSPSVMRVSKYNGLRAHTHASTRRLCRPCLCFFIIFLLILFYFIIG